MFRAGLRAQCQPTASLHRPEPTEPPGPDDPDEDDDAPPDPDRMPGEPIPLPIGDPPPVHAPQSAVSPHDVSQLDVLVTKPANFLPAIYLAGF
nr:hypothetical protein [Paraburkholderia rhizosphaerae]